MIALQNEGAKHYMVWLHKTCDAKNRTLSAHLIFITRAEKVQVWTARSKLKCKFHI
jgi:hypothetical protein